MVFDEPGDVCVDGGPCKRSESRCTQLLHRRHGSKQPVSEQLVPSSVGSIAAPASSRSSARRRHRCERVRYPRPRRTATVASRMQGSILRSAPKIPWFF